MSKYRKLADVLPNLHSVVLHSTLNEPFCMRAYTYYTCIYVHVYIIRYTSGGTGIQMFSSGSFLQAAYDMELPLDAHEQRALTWT